MWDVGALSFCFVSVVIPPPPPAQSPYRKTPRFVVPKAVPAHVTARKELKRTLRAMHIHESRHLFGVSGDHFGTGHDGGRGTKRLNRASEGATTPGAGSTSAHSSGVAEGAAGSVGGSVAGGGSGSRGRSKRGRGAATGRSARQRAVRAAMNRDRIRLPPPLPGVSRDSVWKPGSGFYGSYSSTYGGDNGGGVLNGNVTAPPESFPDRSRYVCCCACACCVCVLCVCVVCVC